MRIMRSLNVQRGAILGLVSLRPMPSSVDSTGKKYFRGEQLNSWGGRISAFIISRKALALRIACFTTSDRMCRCQVGKTVTGKSFSPSSHTLLQPVLAARLFQYPRRGEATVTHRVILCRAGAPQPLAIHTQTVSRKDEEQRSDLIHLNSPHSALANPIRICLDSP
jgi:hypothetical protein